MTSAKNKASAKAPFAKKYITLMIVIFCVTFVLAAKSTIAILRPKTWTTSLARTKGNPKATVRITEYMDFQCPACAKGSLFLSQYVREHPERILLEVKYYPLDNMHPHAIRSARYAECAAREGKFWPFHDMVEAKQPEWKGLINADPAFQQIAKDAKIDLNRLNQCLSDDGVKDIVSKEKAEGASLGVTSTPTYFVNGKMVVGTKSLEEELQKQFGGVTN